MTPLRQNSKLVRETNIRSRRRALIVTLYTDTLTLHEKLRPKTTMVEVPYEAIYSIGWKLKDRERRAAKRKAKV